MVSFNGSCFFGVFIDDMIGFVSENCALHSDTYTGGGIDRWGRPGMHAHATIPACGCTAKAHTWHNKPWSCQTTSPQPQGYYCPGR